MLEEKCVAECCGIDAFSLYSDDIKRVASQFDIEKLKNQLTEAMEFIRQHDAEVYVSRKLNNYFHKSVLLKLLQHIIKIS